MRFATATAIPFAPVTAGPTDVAWTPAISLDCRQALVRIPGLGLWMPPADYTIECWNYTDSTDADTAFDIEDDENGQNRILAHLPFSDGTLYFDNGNLNTTGRLRQYAPADLRYQWHHLAFQVDTAANAMRVFIDGQLFCEKAGYDTFKRRAKDFLIGCVHLGSLGEFRLWNYVRTPAQIQETMPRVLASPRPGLIGCWRLDDTLEQGGRIQDRSGYDHHGILNRR